jgi:uncharacterized protein YdiU (UPF0061 family)
VGTFEYVARLGDSEAIKILADYTIDRHYPDVAAAENAYLALLHNVIQRQASLVAQWMLVGFIHGVMNTDNMTISGETIDYGPCAFMDAYDPDTVFSSIDQHGRYRYSNQPLIAQWNLARFAETLLPLLHPDQEKAVALAEEAIHTFSAIFQHHWLMGMRKKLGLFTEEAEDIELIETVLAWMQQHQADYTNTLRALAADTMPQDALFQNAEFMEWHGRWQARLSHQAEPKQASLSLMRAHNPAIHPRNHQVEAALVAATERGDYSLLQRLLAAVTAPYTDAPEYQDYRTPPLPSERVYQTFCGT